MGSQRILVLFMVSMCQCSGCTTVMNTEGATPGMRVNDLRNPNAGINLDTAVIIDDTLQYWEGRTDWSKFLGPVANRADEAKKWGKIAVEQTNTRRSGTGTLEAFAVIRNRTDFPLRIEARTQFFDSSKVPVEAPSAWKRIHLNPNSVETYRETSTREHGIAHYYIEIREGR